MSKFEKYMESVRSLASSNFPGDLGLMVQTVKNIDLLLFEVAVHKNTASDLLKAATMASNRLNSAQPGAGKSVLELGQRNSNMIGVLVVDIELLANNLQQAFDKLPNGIKNQDDMTLLVTAITPLISELPGSVENMRKGNEMVLNCLEELKKLLSGG